VKKTEIWRRSDVFQRIVFCGDPSKSEETGTGKRDPCKRSARREGEEEDPANRKSRRIAAA
jgi:hypothetical protein